MTGARTPGQTIGPFFGYALPFEAGPTLVELDHPGAVRLHGTVTDGNGQPVPDALIELWQADADGRPVTRPGSIHRDGWSFTGWGRAATDIVGHYSFTTVAPGGVSGGAPFFALTIFARGLLDRLFTRAYLPTNEALLSADPLLSSLAAESRRTLILEPDGDGFVFDIVLQGERETTFLHYRARQ